MSVQMKIQEAAKRKVHLTKQGLGLIFKKKCFDVGRT